MHQHHFTFTCLATCFLFSATASAAEKTVTAKIKAVDAAKKSITLDDLALDVTRKTKITVDGTKAALADIKTGQKATVTYDDALEIAITVVVGKDTGAAGITVEVINVEELNTEAIEGHPWISEDGLTIYWGVSATGLDKWTIWTAQRESPQSLFRGKRELFRGHSPVASSDGTEMVFCSSDSPQFFVSTRTEVAKDFGRPKPIRELSFDPKDVPAPRCMSNDSLFLYLEKKQPDENAWDIWVTHRETRNAPWQVPTKVEISVPDKLRFSQPFVTEDQLEMFVTVVDNAEPQTVRLGILTRNAQDKPFSRLRHLDLRDAEGPLPNCFMPRHVPKTQELFLVSRKLFRSEEKMNQWQFDLWIARGFVPPK